MNGSDERALGNYPKKGPLTGLVVGNGMILLEAVVEALRADYSIIARDTGEAVGLAQAASYAARDEALGHVWPRRLRSACRRQSRLLTFRPRAAAA